MCTASRPTTDGRRPTTDDRRLTDRQPTDSRRWTTDDRRPTTDDRRPTEDRGPTTDRRSTTDGRPTDRPTIDKRSTIDERRSTTDDRRPTDGRGPTTDRRSTTDDRPTDRPSIDDRNVFFLRGDLLESSCGRPHRRNLSQKPQTFNQNAHEALIGIGPRMRSPHPTPISKPETSCELTHAKPHSAHPNVLRLQLGYSFALRASSGLRSSEPENGAVSAAA